MDKSLKSKGFLRGVDRPPFSCYTTSINNKERVLIMTKRVSKKMREELSIHQTFRMYDYNGDYNPIRFIAAHKGGIQMFSNPGELVAWAKTPEMIAYALRTKGADDIIMGSSSMDFASEEGFDLDEDATILWDEGYDMYLDEVATVGVK
tara:strand:+ start:137 stop:583 length:447 start_codon:yes stop_codon:yes gene_type:complete